MKVKMGKARWRISTAFLSIVMLVSCAKVSFLPTEISTTASVEQPANFISETKVVPQGNKQVDFLLILDDSDSMQADLAKLATKMTSFINRLQNDHIDWQMCFVTTRGIANGSQVAFGTPRNWLNYTPPSGVPQYLLKKGTPNLSSIFTSTIAALQIGGGLSWDERAIMAAYQNFQNSAVNGCYRTGSVVSVIAISNEDERSIGGDKTKLKANDFELSYQPLEKGDRPEDLVAQARETFGADVRFNFNSIIVKPGDVACEAKEDLERSPCHPGHLYSQMSELTGGGVGSICDDDFSSTMNSFSQIVMNSVSQMNLQCAPDQASLTVTVDGKKVDGVSIVNDVLKFPYPLNEGTKVQLKYLCK